MKKSALLVLIPLFIAACGDGRETVSNPTVKYDDSFELTLYSSVNSNECALPSNKLTINIKDSVIVDSKWSGLPVIGDVKEGAVTAFIKGENNITVIIEGTFTGTWRGTWEFSNGTCNGYFEQ
jgi:cellulase/cellobiase CelA1